MHSFWKNILHDVRVYKVSLWIQFKAAAALRGAFIAQILGMILNNVAVVTAWFFFFERFGVINGWGIAQFAAMQGVGMVVFGAIILISTGILDLPRHVDTGSLDGFLTKPSSVLGQIGSSNIDITTIGDIILGTGIVAWYLLYSDFTALAFLLFMVAIATAFVVFWCFAILLPQIMAFYIFDAERLSRYMGTIFLDGMNYPGGLFTGPLRVVLLTVMPSLMIGVVPVDALRSLHWGWVGLGVLVAAFWWCFTMWLFKHALKRYESANLIGAR